MHSIYAIFFITESLFSFFSEIVPTARALTYLILFDSKAKRKKKFNLLIIDPSVLYAQAIIIIIIGDSNRMYAMQSVIIMISNQYF